MPAPTIDADALRERFGRWLSERRLPLTRQRAAVADLVFEARDHPSAEHIRRELNRRGARVGTATIYRTLDLLRSAGCVAAHDFGDGHRRFEPMPAEAHHEHIVCRRCGRVIEFSHERLERMLQLVADEHGFLMQDHQVAIRGLCADCRRRDLGALAPVRRR